MNYDLAHMAYQAGLRADIEIRPRRYTQTQEQDLGRILMPVVRHWQKQIPKLTSRNSFDAAPKEGEIEVAGLEGRGVVGAAITAFLRWLSKLDLWSRLQWVTAVRSSTGLEIGNLAPTLSTSNDLKLSVEWAVSLIRDLDATMKRRIQGAMIDATIRGLPRSEVAKLLSKEVGIAKRRVKLIARDQTQKIAGKLNELQQRAAGVTKYVWQHSFRKNPRMHHVRRQGLVFEWSRPPYDGHPSHAINCRCDAVALLRPQTRREVYLNG